MHKVPPYKKQRNRKIQPTAKTNVVPFQFTSFPTPIFFCHECVKRLQTPGTPWGYNTETAGSDAPDFLYSA